VRERRAWRTTAGSWTSMCPSLSWAVRSEWRQ
jgi:hypothetical protein